MASESTQARLATLEGSRSTSVEAAAAKASAVSAGSSNSLTATTQEGEFCFTDVRADQLGDMDYLDVVAFGAFFDCGEGIWAVAAGMADPWSPTELDYLEFYFDTDDSLNTGCYGDDFSVFGFYDETAGWLAGVWSTPNCDAATWSLVEAAGIAYSAEDRQLAMAFSESAIGSPDEMWYYGWLENVYSYNVEQIGDGSSFFLSGFHDVAVPAPASVALTATAALTRSKIALGSTSVIKGSLTPTYEGAVVRLQKLASGTWKTIGSKTLTSGISHYSFSVSPSASGIHYYRIAAPGDDGHLSDTSPKRALTVYRAAITSIAYNPPGRDANNLNGEYAVVKNTGATAINLQNWKLDAGDGKVRTLPSYALAKGSIVRLHTGSGTNGNGHIYLRFGTPIWNDAADIGKLFDPYGKRVSLYRY